MLLTIKKFTYWRAKNVTIKQPIFLWSWGTDSSNWDSCSIVGAPIVLLEDDAVTYWWSWYSHMHTLLSVIFGFVAVL